MHLEYALTHTTIQDDCVSIEIHIALKNNRYEIDLFYVEDFDFSDFDHLGGRLEYLKNNHPFYLFRLCESPIELEFFIHGFHSIRGLIPQWVIGPYRADFAIPSKKIAIEIDGHEYHKSKHQRTSDAKRERCMQAKGWKVIRFTGSEIFRNVSACIESVKDIQRAI